MRLTSTNLGTRLRELCLYDEFLSRTRTEKMSTDLKRQLRRWGRTFGNTYAEIKDLNAQVQRLNAEDIRDNHDKELGSAVAYLQQTLAELETELAWSADDVEDLPQHRLMLGQYKKIEELLEQLPEDTGDKE